MEGFDLYLEIFGYIGTALVIISMMMTSVVKLRIFNICGSLISMTYAIITATWPIVVLNFSLVAINLFHLLRSKMSKKSFTCLMLEEDDKCLDCFLSYYAQDIKKFFPDCDLKYNSKSVYAVFSGAEIVGIVIGTKSGENIEIDLDYAVPAYRDLSVGKFIYEYLSNSGITTICASSKNTTHLSYLKKMGFIEDNGKMTKKV